MLPGGWREVHWCTLVYTDFALWVKIAVGCTLIQSTPYISEILRKPTREEEGKGRQALHTRQI